jgi:hypothetical protein
LRPGLLGLLERVRSLGRLLIGRRLRLRKLMLHAEFLHRNLMLGLELVGVHLSLKLHLLQPHAVLFDGRLILHIGLRLYRPWLLPQRSEH